jgi:hypothetical protein
MAPTADTVITIRTAAKRFIDAIILANLRFLPVPNFVLFLLL